MLNKPQTKDFLDEHENSKASIVREYKCNFCGFYLPKYLRKHAKENSIGFFYKQLPSHVHVFNNHTYLVCALQLAIF